MDLNSRETIFYADGIVLRVTTASDSKETIRKWFNYEFLDEREWGFSISEKNTITITTFEPLTKRVVLLTGTIKTNGEVIELVNHHYDEGMVKSKKYERLLYLNHSIEI